MALTRLASLLRNLFHKQRMERELDEEVRSYEHMLAEEKILAGVNPQQAYRQARIELGGREQVKEQVREVRAGQLLETLFQDVHFGLRMLCKNPGFTCIMALILALGIGANVAIFSLVYTVLLKPLPFRTPTQLVRIFEANDRGGLPAEGCSYAEFQEWQRQNHVFSGMAAVAAHELTLTGAGDPTTVRVGDVTADFFAVLGAQPLIGRAFLAADDEQGAAPVVVIGENLWRDRFSADLGVIGKTIDLDKRAFTVAGVMPKSFNFSFLEEGLSRELWIPIIQDPLFGAWAKRSDVDIGTVLARVKPGVSSKQAQAAMEALGNRLAQYYHPGEKGRTIRFASLREAVTGDASAPLLLLLAAVGLVLLIACANVANLLLARATARAKEFAMRAALGAGRARIVRQLLTESALLGFLGAALGIGFAYWGIKGLSGLLPPSLPGTGSIAVDKAVLAFSLVLSLGASLLFGMTPALFAADPLRQITLQENATRGGEGTRRRQARKLVVTAEIALAMVLLVGAGLFIRSFAALVSVNPGFETRKILKAEVSLPRFQYSTPQQWVGFSDELLARVQAEPELKDAAVAVPLPLTTQSVNLPFLIANAPRLPPGRINSADYVAVSPGYFQVMSIPLLSGRYFSQRDSASTPRVAIISEQLARLYFSHRDPLGQQLVFGFPPDSSVKRKIIGVVGDVRDVALNQRPGPIMYVPFDQAPFWGVYLVVKTSSSASAALSAIRLKVREVDRDLPVSDVGWMGDSVDASLGQARLRTWLLSAFGSLALALAAAGVFGVVSYSVSHRTREFGIRMALGASASEIMRLVLGEALRLTLAGVMIGTAAALGLTRLVVNLLFGVRATDPTTFMLLPLLLTGAVLLAAYFPARRAARVDPIVALRYE